MQLLICREFNKSIISQVLLCQILVALLTLKSLLNCLIALKASKYVASLIY
jgi:hypothetical protein